MTENTLQPVAPATVLLFHDGVNKRLTGTVYFYGPCEITFKRTFTASRRRSAFAALVVAPHRRGPVSGRPSNRPSLPCWTTSSST